KVTRTTLPGKSNFAMAQAAARPNRRLIGTAIAAASSVRRMAAHASGSANEARYAPSPFSSACAKTATTGRQTNRTRNASAVPISATRTTAGSRAGPGRAGSDAPSFSRGLVAPAPPLEPVDREQQDERRDQHHHGDACRARVVVLLELGDDQERRDLRPHRHVAGDEDDRAILAERTSEGQREPGQD